MAQLLCCGSTFSSCFLKEMHPRTSTTCSMSEPSMSWLQSCLLLYVLVPGDVHLDFEPALIFLFLPSLIILFFALCLVQWGGCASCLHFFFLTDSPFFLRIICRNSIHGLNSQLFQFFSYIHLKCLNKTKDFEMLIYIAPNHIL